MFSDMPVIEFPVLLLIPTTRGDFPPIYTPSNHRNWLDTTKLTIRYVQNSEMKPLNFTYPS